MNIIQKMAINVGDAALQITKNLMYGLPNIVCVCGGGGGTTYHCKHTFPMADTQDCTCRSKTLVCSCMLPHEDICETHLCIH